MAVGRCALWQLDAIQDLHKVESLVGMGLAPSPLSCCDRVSTLRCTPTEALRSTRPLSTTSKVHTLSFYVRLLD